jgi:hypothetical protein
MDEAKAKDEGKSTFIVHLRDLSEGKRGEEEFWRREGRTLGRGRTIVELACLREHHLRRGALCLERAHLGRGAHMLEKRARHL